MTAAYSECEDEYSDDPIKLIDFEQSRVLDITQRFVGKNIEPTSENSDGHRSTLFEQSIVSISNTRESDEINQIDCVQINVKLVDCAKFPWYYKKYTNQIVTKITSLNDSDDVSNDEIIDLDESDLEDCVIMDNEFSEHTANDTQDTFSEMQPTGNQKTEYLEVLKHKARKTLDSKDKVDFKRNVGLVGLTIKHKIPAAVRDANTIRNKKAEPSPMKTYLDIADKMLNRYGTDLITILEDPDKALSSSKNKAKKDIAYDDKNQQDHVDNTLNMSSKSSLNEVGQDIVQLVDSTNIPKNNNICTDKVSESSQNQIILVKPSKKLQLKCSNISHKKANENIKDLNLIENDKSKIQNNARIKSPQCNKQQKKVSLDFLSVPISTENKITEEIRGNTKVKINKNIVNSNDTLDKKQISEDTKNNITTLSTSQSYDSSESKNSNKKEHCISKPKKISTLKYDAIDKKSVASMSNKDNLLRTTSEKITLSDIADSNSIDFKSEKKKNCSSVADTKNRMNGPIKKSYKVCPTSKHPNRTGNKLLHYYSLSYPQKVMPSIDSQNKEDTCNKSNSLLPTCNVKVSHNAPIPRDQTVSKKAGTIHILPVESINRNKGQVNPITTNTSEMPLMPKTANKETPNLIPVCDTYAISMKQNYNDVNAASQKSFNDDSLVFHLPISGTQDNPVTTNTNETSITSTITEKDTLNLIPVNNINTLNTPSKNYNPGNQGTQKSFKIDVFQVPIPSGTQQNAVITNTTEIPLTSKTPAIETPLIPVNDINTLNTLTQKPNYNPGNQDPQKIFKVDPKTFQQPIPNTQIPKVIVNSNNRFHSDPRFGRPIQTCHNTGPIYDKLFNFPIFRPQRVLSPVFMTPNTRNQNFNFAPYYQHNASGPFKPNIVRKRSPSNKDIFIPPAYMNRFPLAHGNDVIPNVHVNGIHLPMSYIARLDSQTHLPQPPPPPLPLLPPRPEQTAVDNFYPLKTQVNVTISAHNSCKKNKLSPISETNRNIALPIDNKCKTTTTDLNDMIDKTTLDPSNIEIIEPVKTKNEMLEELDKDIIIEDVNKEDMARSNENKSNKIYFTHDNPTISKTETFSAKTYPKLAKPIVDRISERNVKGYSPPILPIPSTIEEILQNAITVPPKNNLMVKEPRPNEKYDFSNLRNIAPRPKEKKPKPNKEDAKKISLDEYKKRICTNDVSDRPNKMLRKDEPNPKKHTSTKYKYRNLSIDSDLGYDSDSTVIII